jgi:tetratricopeptide (TPR) repeat protein
LGWWSNLKTKREVETARREMVSARSPYTVATFIEKCIELKQLDDALAEAERGLAEFPQSEALLDSYKHLIRVKCDDDLKAYRHEVKTQPGPKAYYRLSCLYKEMRDYDQSIELARKGVELYPNFEGNYIVLGDIRYERFQRDLRASDGQLAIEHFEKASDLNRENYRLLYQLAEIYSAVGARDTAIDKINSILAFAPDDANALKLLEEVQKKKPSKYKELKEILQEFERKAQSSAEKRALNMGPLGQRYTRNPEHLARKLRSLERIEGFRRAIVLGPSGELLAGYPGGPDVNKPVGDAAKDIFEAASECSLKMDISTFETGFFETPGGFVYMTVVDRLRLSVLCGNNAKKDRMLAEVFKFVEHDLYI